MAKPRHLKRPSVHTNINNQRSQPLSTAKTAAATSPTTSSIPSPKPIQSSVQLPSSTSPQLGASKIPTPTTTTTTTTTSRRSPVSPSPATFTPPQRRQRLPSSPLQQNSTFADFTDSHEESQTSVSTPKAKQSRSSTVANATNTTPVAIRDNTEQQQEAAASIGLGISTATPPPKPYSKEPPAVRPSSNYTTPRSILAGLRSSPVLTASPSTPLRPASPGNSRFAFLSKMSAFSVFGSSPPSTPKFDEISSLDIESQLFPDGMPQEGDPPSPAAFKNLQISATGLAHKLQSAYRARTLQFQDVKADKHALEEEKMQLDTRTQHLKLQLEEMARKATETESIMQELMQELNKEKRLRAEERHGRRSRNAPSVISTVSEDLGAEEDQQQKLWCRSVTDQTDGSSDDDERESMTADSVFSRSRSPTIRSGSVSDASPVDMPPLPDYAKQPQLSAFQKLMKGFSESTIRDAQMTNGCSNCQGQDASMAWDTASVMRDENRGLKFRVTELESALEGALDVVNKVGL